MMKQFFAETLIVATGTLFFFGLSATFGIPGRDGDTPATATAEEVQSAAPMPRGMGSPQMRGDLGYGYAARENVRAKRAPQAPLDFLAPFPAGFRNTLWESPSRR